MTRLLLLGGGHSHIQVLRALARRPSSDLDLTVISRDVLTAYSGMLPGVIAGHYPAAAAHIDLAPLCAAAGAELRQDTVIALEPGAQRVHCASGAESSWDLLSINTGASPDLAAIRGADGCGVPVKPINEFLGRWEQLLARLKAQPGQARRLLVVGAGAGGIELALALDYRLRRCEGLGQLRIALLDAGSRLLPAHPPQLGCCLTRLLAQRDVALYLNSRVAKARPGELTTGDGRQIGADEVLWVTPAGAPDWPAAAGLATDAAGFIEVDGKLRSVSHPTVFAAGDVASFGPSALPKAGVFAVRQGPVLAANLQRAASGNALREYQPQARYLSLISAGDRYAVASRGRWTAQGAWVWHWKDWLDRRFVEGFRFSPR